MTQMNKRQEYIWVSISFCIQKDNHSCPLSQGCLETRQQLTVSFPSPVLAYIPFNCDSLFMWVPSVYQNASHDSPSPSSPFQLMPIHPSILNSKCLFSDPSQLLLLLQLFLYVFHELKLYNMCMMISFFPLGCKYSQSRVHICLAHYCVSCSLANC